MHAIFYSAKFRHCVFVFKRAETTFYSRVLRGFIDVTFAIRALFHVKKEVGFTMTQRLLVVVMVAIIPDIFLVGEFPPPKKKLAIPPNGCQIVCSKTFFRPGQ